MGTAAKLIADDRRAVSYRPRFARLVGSVLGAILLQQMIYWWDNNGEKPFFKFKEPCQNKEYRPGDSWCEELGFTRYEFDTTLALIGTKVVKGISKTMAMEWEIARLADFPNDDPGFVAGMRRSIQHLVVYWTDSNRQTWYWVNATLLDKVADQLYLDKSDLQLYLGKVKRPLYLLSEMNSGDEHKEEVNTSANIANASSQASDPPPPLSVQVFGSEPKRGSRSETPDTDAIKGIGPELPPGSVAPPAVGEWNLINLDTGALVETFTNPILAKDRAKELNAIGGAKYVTRIVKPLTKVKDKAEKKPRDAPKPWSALTKAMHEATPEAVRPPSCHYGKNNTDAKACYDAGIAAQEVTGYVKNAYETDDYLCGTKDGKPKAIWMGYVNDHIKEWKAKVNGAHPGPANGRRPDESDEQYWERHDREQSERWGPQYKRAT